MIPEHIDNLYQANTMIVCCAESYQSFMRGDRDTLEVRLEAVCQEITPPTKDYQHYSHGLHPRHIEKYLNQLK